MTGEMRRPLADVEEYRRLKGAYKERFGKLRSNCYLGSAALADEVAKAGVSLVQAEGGFLLLIDEGPYERVYYFLGEAERFPRLAGCGKSLLLEEIDANGRNEQCIEVLWDELRELGWKRRARNLQVAADLRKCGENLPRELEGATSKLKSSGLAFRPCGREQLADVLSLWEGYLKETDVPAAHRDFLDDDAQHVVCVVDGQGTVCGVNWWSCVGAACEVRHTVTDPRFYRRGIGYAVLVYAMEDAAQRGCSRVFTYIDEENMRSLALYGKAGFELNGRSSTQFVLE